MKTLFLHWGPGGNAQIERLWFKDQLPVYWWDQPHVSGEGSFEKIVESTKSQVEVIFETEKKPVRLLAHSFGGRIAQELCEIIPDKISQITLISCGHDPWMSFFHLAHALSKKNENLPSLAEKMEKTRSFEDFWELIGMITHISDFQNCYWTNKEAQKKYASFAANLQLIDFPTFEWVMRGFENKRPALKPSNRTKHIPVKCFLGEGDPLQDTNAESKAWQTIFPQCEVSIMKNSGHFIHFENPQESWF